MVPHNSSTFIMLMFSIFCGINIIFSIISLMVVTQKADAQFFLNITIIVFNFLIGILVFSTFIFIEERKKKERANQESLEENSYILEIPSPPSYDSQDSFSLAPPYDLSYFENSVDSVDSAN